MLEGVHQWLKNVRKALSDVSHEVEELNNQIDPLEMKIDEMKLVSLKQMMTNLCITDISKIFTKYYLGSFTP